jgi:hypothetical protein
MMPELQSVDGKAVPFKTGQRRVPRQVAARCRRVAGRLGRMEDSLAVFDIDGVVADVRHRLKYLDRRPKDWPRFFAAADRDPVLAEGATLARAYAASHVLVWLTGRPEHLRDLTAAWLRAADLPADLLFMRPPNDRRPARDFKARQLAQLARASTIELVVDDDPAVVTRLRELGYPVQLAAWVPHSSTLQTAQEKEGRT